MNRPLRTIAGLLALLVLILALVVQACQDDPTSMVAGPNQAAAVTRTLKVMAVGTGSGSVTAPAVGGATPLNCQITAGTFDPIECTKAYTQGTSVTLTATPAAGSVFKEWRNGCVGTSPTCTVSMSANKTVRAVFRPGAPTSFALNVTGGGSGAGVVTSQPELTPAINCTVNAGTVTGDCSQTYPSGTSVTLTATPDPDNIFNDWGGDCTGSGTCTLTMTANRAAAANLTAPLGPESEVGRWASPHTNPIIGLHTTLLPDGDVLMWGHTGEAQVWHAASGSFTQVANTICNDPAGCELFCAGHAYLGDGRILVAGGHNEALGNNNGLAQTSIFDGSSWQPAPPMKYKRWYPTLVTLADGEVIVLSGNQTPGAVALFPERWNGSAWTELTGASLSLQLYPRAFVEPKNGNVFVASPGATKVLDPTGTGSWSNGPAKQENSRSYGGAVMLDSKVVIAGGGGANCPNPPLRSTEIIDLADPSPSWQLTGSLNVGRRQLNLTILPDGKVLATGGTSACGFSNEAGAVFSAEIWDPQTGAWTTVASAAVVRVYHSTTLLLPDGRVLSTGSGDGGGVSQQKTYEIYSPPYLFKGPRPSYDLVGTTMHYGQSFDVTTPDAASISKVTMIRLPSTTHAFDMSQRLNTLLFAPSADGLTLTAPASGLIAPPGPYMLFLVNGEGVPSVAETVMVGP